MKRGIVILIFVFLSLILYAFVIKFTNFLPTKNANAAVLLVDTSIPPAMQKQLREQAINQFYSLVDYDLEALDEYAPKDEEMKDFYKIFDEMAFTNRYPVFERAFNEVNKKFGEDFTLDRNYLLNINTRISAVQVRNQIANYENVDLNISDYVIDKIVVEPVENNKELINLIVRIYCEEKESFYDFVNEACWLTNRTCITNFGWKFLGKYNPYTKKYTNSEFHLKNL